MVFFTFNTVENLLLGCAKNREISIICDWSQRFHVLVLAEKTIFKRIVEEIRINLQFPTYYKAVHFRTYSVASWKACFLVKILRG